MRKGVQWEALKIDLYAKRALVVDMWWEELNTGIEKDVLGLAPNVNFYEKMVNVYLLSEMEFANDSPYKRVLEVALTTAYALF